LLFIGFHTSIWQGKCPESLNLARDRGVKQLIIFLLLL